MVQMFSLATDQATKSNPRQVLSKNEYPKYRSQLVLGGPCSILTIPDTQKMFDTIQKTHRWTCHSVTNISLPNYEIAVQDSSSLTNSPQVCDPLLLLRHHHMWVPHDFLKEPLTLYTILFPLLLYELAREPPKSLPNIRVL